jgi:hypothetical protein
MISPRISFVLTAGDKGNRRAICTMELNVFKINQLWMEGEESDALRCIEMRTFSDSICIFCSSVTY